MYSLQNVNHDGWSRPNGYLPIFPGNNQPFTPENPIKRINAESSYCSEVNESPNKKRKFEHLKKSNEIGKCHKSFNINNFVEELCTNIPEELSFDAKQCNENFLEKKYYPQPADFYVPPTAAASTHLLIENIPLDLVPPNNKELPSKIPEVISFDPAQDDKNFVENKCDPHPADYYVLPTDTISMYPQIENVPLDSITQDHKELPNKIDFLQKIIDQKVIDHGNGISEEQIQKLFSSSLKNDVKDRIISLVNHAYLIELVPGRFIVNLEVFSKLKKQQAKACRDKNSDSKKVVECKFYNFFPRPQSVNRAQPITSIANHTQSQACLAPHLTSEFKPGRGYPQSVDKIASHSVSMTNPTPRVPNTTYFLSKFQQQEGRFPLVLNILPKPQPKANVTSTSKHIFWHGSKCAEIG